MLYDPHANRERVVVSASVMTLAHHFEDLDPTTWWFYVFLLVLRIMQTSMITFFNRASVQASTSIMVVWHIRIASLHSETQALVYDAAVEGVFAPRSRGSAVSRHVPRAVAAPHLRVSLPERHGIVRPKPPPAAAVAAHGSALLAALPASALP